MNAVPLPKLARWITSPSTAGGATAAGLGVLYGAFTLHPPPGTFGWLCGIAAVVAALATVAGDRVEQRGLRVIRQLGAGALPTTPEHLREAVREAFALPDLSFRVNLGAWVLGSTAAGFLLSLVPAAPWGLCLRVAYLGVAIGPLSSMVTYLLVVERARKAVLILASHGLASQEVIAAAPGKRRALRRRLVAFVSVAAMTPSVLVGDMLFSHASELMDEVLVAPTEAAQRQVVERFERVGDAVLLGCVVAGLGILAAYLGATSLAKPLRDITDEATRIAKGDLLNPRLIPAEDEVWAASASFSAMAVQLTQALTRLRGAGQQIVSTSEQLLAGGDAQIAGASEQAAALNETSATTEELARSAAQIADNASEVSALAQRTLQAAQRGRQSSEAFYASMMRMRADNEHVAESVLQLNKRVQQIGKIVEFINGVGDKSDLLALNAELEGTKAGEVGRGFSLVAAEMRRLAEHVIRSTQEIERLIGEIRDGTHAAVMATESGMKAMEAGIAMANGVLEGFNTIVELAQSTSQAVHLISVATQQQGQGTDQLAAAMAEILRITLEGKASSDQMSKANAALSALAGELQGVVDSFQLATAGEGTANG